MYSNLNTLVGFIALFSTSKANRTSLGPNHLVLALYPLRKLKCNLSPVCQHNKLIIKSAFQRPRHLCRKSGTQQGEPMQSIKQQHEFDQGMLKCFFGYWVLRFSFMPLCISVKVYFSCLNSELGNTSASKGSKNMTTTNNPEFLQNYLHHKSVQTKDSENMITNNPEFLRAVIRLQLMFKFVSQ